MVGLGRDLGDAPEYVTCNDLGTAVLLTAMARLRVSELVLAGSMVHYGEGRYDCARHGTVRPGPAPGCRPGRRTTALLVIAKEPRPGHVTTRLTPPFTPAQAAALAEAALADTLETVLRCPARRRVLILDGAPGRWLPPGIEVIPQAPGGLDERLAAAYLAVTDGPALLVGGGPPFKV